MPGQSIEVILNRVLIQLSRSFLQYVSESSPWVRYDAPGLAAEIESLASKQREDVGLLVELLNEREHFVDFGSFPTEYTDQQFLGLDVLIGRLERSQSRINGLIATAVESVKADEEAASLLSQVSQAERQIENSLASIAKDLKQPA
jgi:hypothetical protein